MIEVDCVSFSYPGREKLLDGISFVLQKPELVALIGPNGSGKSTLALLLNGLLQPSSGKVFVDGLDTTDPTLGHDIRHRVGIVFQNPEHQIIADTVEEDIAFGMELLNKPRSEMQDNVGQLLSEFHLERMAQRSPDRLSGGEKQRLALAATLITNPDYLILDEPTALLDRQSCDDFLLRLEKLHQNTGILFITPFPEETAFADRLLYLDNGTLREIPKQERTDFCRALEDED